MKKNLMVAGIMCMMIAFTACSNNTKENEIPQKTAADKSTEGTETDKKTYKIGKGEEAPDIEFTLADGTTAKLSDYKGKPVLLNFWATWCGYCIEEMPAFEKLKENYGDKIEIIALNSSDSLEDINEFIEENGYTFKMASISFEEESKYQVQSLPSTAIINADGVFTYLSAGAIDADTMYNDYYEPVVKEVLGIE